MKYDRLFEIFVSGFSVGVNVVICFAFLYLFLRFLEWGSKRISKARLEKMKGDKNGTTH